MPRAVLDLIAERLESAYRGDGFHSLRGNLESVLDAEWDVRPARPSVEEFGAQPERLNPVIGRWEPWSHLSIADLVLHAGIPKLLYAARVRGDLALDWADIVLPRSHDRADMMAWLDDAHRTLQEAAAGLADDADLAIMRPVPSLMRSLGDVLWTQVAHDLYHAGEVNRQRALMRGAEGWAR